MGSGFPQPVNPGEFFLITLEDIAAPLIREIVKISGRSGDILTVAVGGRAQEGTVALAWNATNTLVDHRITAETIRQAFLQPVATGPAGGGGFEYSPITVEVGWTLDVAAVPYSHTHRGNKFWVSMVSPNNFKAQSFEVLTVIQGDLSSNAETVNWTRTNRIGYNFLGNTLIMLNTATKQLSVQWQNTEPLVDVIVTVVRI
jgi:hypothetical protein